MTSSYDLSAFFQPHGVAVIGASREPHKMGYGVVRNLVQYGYQGAIYPVNPNADTILGLKTYPSIAAVPDPLDLAVICVPAPRVEAELEACGERGVRAVTVISGGFRETGPEGAAREEAIKGVIRQYGIALVGPNCIGTIDTHTPLNTTFVVGVPRPGDIGFVSQSGALVVAIMDWARSAGVGFSRIVSLGNQAGVSEAELIEVISRDPQTNVVTVYMEGVSDGRKFVEIVGQVARRKPVIALKAGRGQGGAKAVASHTGALAGAESAYDAAFRRAGVLRADTMEEMFDWARTLASQPLPRGNRVAVLTNAGGLGVVAMDALEMAGLKQAVLSDATKAFIRARIPPAASAENPVDVIAGSGPAVYGLCLDALLADPGVDAVVVAMAPNDWFAPVSLADVLGDVSTSPLARGKPILSVLMGITPESEAARVLQQRHVPNFTFPERAGRALASMWQRKQWLDSLAEIGELTRPPECDLETARITIEAGLQVNRQMPAGNGWLTPEQVELLLAAYCIRTPASGLAPNIEHALALAKTVGYPVALKLAAEGLTHKTDVGGVMLNLENASELRSAFKAMMRQAGKTPFGSGVKGAYVQRMVKGQAEIIVGVVRDPQFGPLVMAGVGGTRVELQREVAFELAPLTRQQANDLLDRTAAGALLAGYRGAVPADREAVVDVILRLAQISLDWAEISEIEINPLIVQEAGQGAYAVDARVRLAVE